jgi:hypothetical protein
MAARLPTAAERPSGIRFRRMARHQKMIAICERMFQVEP